MGGQIDEWVGGLMDCSVGGWVDGWMRRREEERREESGWVDVEMDRWIRGQIKR